MRYFTKEDMNLDGSKEIVYSSSRLMYEDIRSSLKSGDETKEDSKKQDDSSGTMPLSSKSNPQKLAPSFFSRTYVSWTLLNEKMSVYTPV